MDCGPKRSASCRVDEEDNSDTLLAVDTSTETFNSSSAAWKTSIFSPSRSYFAVAMMLGTRMQMRETTGMRMKCVLMKAGLVRARRRGWLMKRGVKIEDGEAGSVVEKPRVARLTVMAQIYEEQPKCKFLPLGLS